MPLVPLAAAFAAGIGLAALLRLPLPFWASLALWPVGYLFLFRRAAPRLVMLGLLAAFLGSLRLAWTQVTPPADALVYHNDAGPAILTGLVVEPPDPRDTYVNLRVQVDEVQWGERVEPVHGLALVQASRGLTVRYGDRVRVEGTPTTPSIGTTPDFSYRDYLARQGILTQVRLARVRVLAHDAGNPFFAALYTLRERAQSTITLLLPEPSAALLSGILLGADQGIPPGLKDDFSATNTAHIIAISGFNLAVLAGLFSRLVQAVLRGRHKGLGTAIVIAGLVAYTLAVGAGASVVRAAIMGSLSLLALQFGRRTLALNSLAIAVLAMLAWDPQTMWDAGFQLSVLATLGILLFATGLTAELTAFLFAALDRDLATPGAAAVAHFLADNLIVTFAAQITTTPLIAYLFHRLSFVGLLTNLLILPAQEGVMLLGGLATILGMIWLPLGQAVACLAWVFLAWTIGVVQWTAAIPLAALDLGPLEWPPLALYYLLLWVGWRWALGQRIVSVPNPAQAFGRPLLPLALTGCVLLIAFNLVQTQPDGRTHVEFLATESGEATLVRTGGGARILVDATNTPSEILSALGTRLPFWDRRLDLLVLTRSDDEHVNGASALLERYPVGMILEPEGPDKWTPAYSRWRALVRDKGIVAQPARAGLALELDGTRLEILYPMEPDTQTVARLEVGPLTVLYASALAKADQDAWLASDPADLQASVLVSPRALSNTLVARADPGTVLFFAGRAAHEKPGEAALELCGERPILRTDERGTIEAVVEGSRIEWSSAR